MRKNSKFLLLNLLIISYIFSAHWCPPCRRFTPQLASFYKRNKKGNNFEVLFVSSDQNESEMFKYMQAMPWLGVKFQSAASQEIKQSLAGKGIPNLVILDSKGTAIFTTYVDGKYLGPSKALQQFSEMLTNLPESPKQAEAETGADTSPKTNDVKASNTCEVSLMTMSDVMWLNADEQDAMKVKFSVTNNHDFTISGVVVEFKFYDIRGKKLADEKLKSFSESLNAGEVKKFDQFNLGKYPKDTMKVVGEVVSVSN